MKKRVVFRADGNLEIGYGHFIRTIGLAGLISIDFDCIYVTQEPSDYQLKEISNVGSQVISLKKKENNYDEFLNYLKKDDIVVIDDYCFEEEYQNKIRAKGCKLIYIDDHNDKNYVCDVLINNIPGFLYESFKKNDYTKLCLGTDYALLREAFFNEKLRNVDKKIDSIFLSFGGADINNLSEKIINFLYKINPNFEINLMIGDSYKFFDSLLKFKKLHIYKNLNANDVAHLIAESDIVIIPASSLLNEAACIGSKILVGFFADNQIQPYDYFINNNLAIGLGDYRKLNFEIFNEIFEKVKKSKFMIDNQKKIYHYQQIFNLKKIFYDI